MTKPLYPPTATPTALGAVRRFWYDPYQYGLVADGVTDDTAAVNAVIAAARAANAAGIEWPAATILCLGQIVLPATGGRSMAWRGAGITGSPSGSTPSGGTIFDLRYSGADAKIVTLGYGTLEVTGISFMDGGSDTTPFLLTTRTVLRLWGCEFYGTATGTQYTQDAIILGGTGNTDSGIVTGQFAGYGTFIANNAFNRVQRAVLLQTYANSPIIMGNWIGGNCGGVAAIDCEPVLTGDINAGGYIAGNLFELPHYTYAIKVKNTQFLTIVGNNCHDAVGGTTTAYYRFESDAVSNLVIPGVYNATIPLLSDANGSNTVLASGQGQGWTINTPVAVVGPSGGSGHALTIKTNAGTNTGLDIQATGFAANDAIGTYPMRLLDKNGNHIMSMGRDSAGRFNPAVRSSASGDSAGAQPLYLTGYGGLYLNIDTGAAVNIGSTNNAPVVVGGSTSTRQHTWYGYLSFPSTPPASGTNALVTLGNGGFSGANGAFGLTLAGAGSASASGTVIGINDLGTSGADFVNAQVGGTSFWRVTAAGVATHAGALTAQAIAASGMTGATAASRHVGGTTGGAPTTGTFAVGDFAIDQTGKIFICTVAGTPGTWVQG